jgi:hypothetical protein
MRMPAIAESKMISAEEKQRQLWDATDRYPCSVPEKTFPQKTRARIFQRAKSDDEKVALHALATGD